MHSFCPLIPPIHTVDLRIGHVHLCCISVELLLQYYFALHIRIKFRSRASGLVIVDVLASTQFLFACSVTNRSTHWVSYCSSGETSEVLSAVWQCVCLYRRVSTNKEGERQQAWRVGGLIVFGRESTTERRTKNFCTQYSSS